MYFIVLSKRSIELDLVESSLCRTGLLCDLGEGVFAVRFRILLAPSIGLVDKGIRVLAVVARCKGVLGSIGLEVKVLGG